MNNQRRASEDHSEARLSMREGRPRRPGRIPRKAAPVAPALVMTAVAVTVAAVLAAVVFQPRIVTLPLLLLKNGNGSIAASVALPGGHFVHRYVHSIHRTQVDEEFRVEDGKLVLFRLRYDTYGVGMPNDAGEGFRVEGGRFILDMHRSFSSIAMRVSPVPGDGILQGAMDLSPEPETVTGKFHPFTEWVPAESLITLVPGLRREIHFGR